MFTIYYLGIDGGSLYSRLVAVDDDMKIIGRHAGNSVNPRIFSMESIFENLHKLVTEFNRLTNTSISDCISVCIGSAGITKIQDIKNIIEIFQRIGFNCNISVVSDAEIIIATEARGGAGAVIIANVGSVGYAIGRDGKKYRTGGWGYLIDDGGSGYNIGMSAIRYALMAIDGRGEKTVLVEKICEQFKLKNIEEITDIVYSEDFSRIKISELALTVKYASLSGDEVAMKIEESAAHELAGLTLSLIERSKLRDEVIVLSGNVILLNDNIRDKMCELVLKQQKNVKIVPLKEKPEMGAVYLAMESFKRNNKNNII